MVTKLTLVTDGLEQIHINLSASTDLDNGFTVSHTQNIGGGGADNNAMTSIAMGDMGTFRIPPHFRKLNCF